MLAALSVCSIDRLIVTTWQPLNKVDLWDLTHERCAQDELIPASPSLGLQSCPIGWSTPLASRLEHLIDSITSSNPAHLSSQSLHVSGCNCALPLLVVATCSCSVILLLLTSNQLRTGVSKVQGSSFSGRYFIRSSTLVVTVGSVTSWRNRTKN